MHNVTIHPKFGGEFLISQS